MGVMHIVPFCLIAYDFSMSGINIYKSHFFLFLVLSLGYLGINLLQSFFSKDSRTIYACLDWHRRPDIAAAVVAAFIVLELLIYVGIFKLTDRKLSKHFRIITNSSKADQVKPQTAVPLDPENAAKNSELDESDEVSVKRQDTLTDSPMKP